MLLFAQRFLRAARAVLVTLAGLVGSCAVHAETVAVTGTLPEDYLPGLRAVLETAMRQSPQMLLRQLEVDRSEAQVIISDAERLPRLGGDVRFNSTRTAATHSQATRDNGLFYSIGANQAVFHWGAIKNRRAMARINLAIAEKNYGEAYRLLAVQLRQSYLQLIAMNAMVRLHRFTVDTQQSDLAVARERLGLGSTSAAEIAGRELDLSEAELVLERAQNELDAELQRFSRLAGLRPGLTPDQLPVDIPLPAYDPALADEILAGFLREGGATTFAAQVAELNRQRADHAYRIARVRLLPRFNTGLVHSRESTTNATATQVAQVAITRQALELRGDWDIFDGFATRGAKRDALAERRGAEKTLAVERDAAMDEMQRRRRTVNYNARAQDIAERRLTGAAVMVKVAEEDMKVAGTGSESAVQTARRNLLAAQYNAALARANFLGEWSAFVSLAAADPVVQTLSPRYVRLSR